jgi:hypothetical protein
MRAVVHLFHPESCIVLSSDQPNGSFNVKRMELEGITIIVAAMTVLMNHGQPVLEGSTLIFSRYVDTTSCVTLSREEYRVQNGQPILWATSISIRDLNTNQQLAGLTSLVGGLH